ncbi:MAG: hypothetical protein IKR40_02440 [Treponema sp.]|nr:hypothetical protein [Treponema sp.]
MKMYIMDFGIVLISGSKKLRYFTLPDKNSVRRMVDALTHPYAEVYIRFVPSD